jgi:outer membrane protein OmpA-like peptidoglycan-associated protein
MKTFKPIVAHHLGRATQPLSADAITQLIMDQVPVAKPKVLAMEVSIACEMLVLGGWASNSDNTYLATPRLLAARRQERYKDPISAKGAARLTTFYGLAVTVAACASLAPAPAPVAHRSADLTLARIEQSSAGDYHFCTNNCPKRTPKTLPVAAAAFPLTAPVAAAPARQDATDVSPAVVPIVQPAALMTATGSADSKPVANPPAAEPGAPVMERNTKLAPPPAQEKNPAPAPTRAPSIQSGPSATASTLSADSIKAPASPTPSPASDQAPRAAKPAKAVLVAASDATAGPALRLDRSFTSYDALVEFGNGLETLGPKGRKVVADLAGRASLAKAVTLRGHVAKRGDLTEADRKLALGRSVAVKLALIDQGVPMRKISVLRPATKLVVEDDRRASANRSVEVTLKSARIAQQ